MLKRRILLLLAALAAICAVLALLLRPAPEPEYGGKKLSEWVMKLSPFYENADRIPAIEAINQIGTNALPYLIKWIGYETPAWKKQVSRAVNRIFRAHWDFLDEPQTDHRTVGTRFALRELGVKAAPAIWDLSRIANDPKRHDTRIFAVGALAGIGVAGLPAIVGVLTNEQSRTAKSSQIRIACAVTISRLARRQAARPAEPTLRSMCEDTDPKVRLAGTNALDAMDPTWLEKLPKATN